ncbi:MAG: sugar phosphate isomerase/epimerase [Actinobacteria bacterium]|nr:sugar phosphate isomerase/epimerase [Actinomycetota bacterium]
MIPAHQEPKGSGPDLAVCLNAYSGYSLEVALAQVREALGWRSAELDAIDGLFCHIDLDRVTSPVYRKGITDVFTDTGVSCRAVSAQRPPVDRLDSAGVARMTGLVELTRELGSDRIILGAGTDEASFRQGIQVLLAIAEPLGLVIGLETQGPRQLVHDSTCVNLIRSIDSEHLDVNYDFGNAYFALDGRLDMLADFLRMQSIVGHAHFKDAVRNADGDFTLSPITGHIVDYAAVLAAIHTQPIPVSIELPRRMILSSGTRRSAVPALATVNGDLAASIELVTGLWRQAHTRDSTPEAPA